MIKRMFPGLLLLFAALAMLVLKTADFWYAIFALSCLCSVWIVGLCFHREEQSALLEQETLLRDVENRLEESQESRKELVKECNQLKEAAVQRAFQEQKKLEKIELERDAANKKTGDLFLELSALKDAHERGAHELTKKVEDAEYRATHLVSEFNALTEKLAHQEKLLQESELELQETTTSAHRWLEELNNARVENFELAKLAEQALSSQEIGDIKQLKNQLAEKSKALNEARSERFHLETELLALQKEKELDELHLDPSDDLKHRIHLEEAVAHLEDLVSLVLTKKRRKKA